ncbi:MAG: GntR family transcriptional regulator [Streptosporangiales bacterium]|nr:GntR family transcriptional regulator [Streptosporangiales bacterium]
MTDPAAGGLLARFAAARQDLGRSSTAARIADLLREQITNGELRPGERLPEEELCKAAKVSRNTLREAFRLLAHERLLVHEFNRGVFVNKLTADDLVDLFHVRRILECEGVRHAGGAAPGAIAALDAAVADGERAAARDDWRGVGTANIRFHQGLAALCGSPRVDEMMRHLLAELRLVFDVMGSPREFHEPYLARNRELTTILQRGEFAIAERELRMYLDDAERQIAGRYREREQAAG